MDMIHVQASVTSLPFQNSGHEAARRSANYHPSIWGDHFLAYDSNLTEIDSREKEEHEQLKQSLMKMLHGAPNKSLQKLELIDAMQRLGVSYHFESDIQQSLECIYNGYQECFEEDGNDLYTVALRFRLLRQQGHRVPCDVFNKFKDLDGKFDASLSNTRGILSLYEVAHFRVHGEDILDDALAFTTSHLEAIKPKLSNLLAAQVSHALRLPIHMAMTRLAAKQYISIYQEDQSSLNCLLLKFAKLDFNILQKMHQRELSGITRWWKSLDFTTNLSFARDRLVECYFWILGVYFEPQYCLARRILTKVIALASTMDDIYDVYGTLDELTLLTDAIERWDITATDQLPWYMQIFYRALLNVYAELEEEVVKERKLYCVKFAKAAMKNLARAYFQEAKWFHNAYVPTYEEYMKNALVSGGYMMLVTNAFASMGTIVTPEGFDWFLDGPLIMKASSVICRLTDDIMTHQIEQQRGDVSSAVECYMRQYGATKEEAFSQFQKQIANAWKDINEECLHPIGVRMPLLMVILNLTRMINLIYKDEDGYTNSKTKLRNFVSSVLVDSG